jgi:hypothetical protein
MLWLAVVAAIGFGGVARAQAPDPNDVYVEGIAYAGSGCPAGSVAGTLSPDAKAFTLLFDDFVASIGPGVPITENRKNCALSVDLHIPNGWSFALASVDYRGFAQLDQGIHGTQKSTYYFQGNLQQASTQLNLAGPFSEDYLRRDILGLTNIVWSKCGETRALNVNAQVRLTKAGGAATAGGQMTVDTIDGAVLQVWHLLWKKCP